MDLKRKGQSFASRMAAVHWAVCGLAIVGALIIQLNWDAVFWQAAVATLVATAWLLATAWLHRELARRGERRLVLAKNEARLNLLGDSVLAGVAGAIIWRGHESPLALTGVWSVCPAILAIGVLSAVALSLDRAVPASPIQLPRLGLLVRGRAVLAGMLIVVLGWLSV